MLNSKQMQRRRTILHQKQERRALWRESLFPNHKKNKSWFKLKKNQKKNNKNKINNLKKSKFKRKHLLFVWFYWQIAAIRKQWEIRSKAYWISPQIKRFMFSRLPQTAPNHSLKIWQRPIHILLSTIIHTLSKICIHSSTINAKPIKS